MMKTFVEELAHGEEKVVRLGGKFLRGCARAVDAGKPVVNAELMLMIDDSAEDDEIRLFYCENSGMNEYVFFKLNEYIGNIGNVLDVLTFSYVKDDVNRTGVVAIVAKTQDASNDLSEAFR